MIHLAARSISRHVRDVMQPSNVSLRVMAVFEHACNLVTLDHGVIARDVIARDVTARDVIARDVIALVTSRIGNGPLNIVVDEHATPFATLQPGGAVTLDGATLRMGDVEVELSGAQTWKPRPDWDALRAASDTIRRRLKRAESIALAHAPAGSLLSSAAPGSDLAYTASTLQAAAADLAQGWHGQSDLIRSGAARIAGLGNGLTPAGDDFLCGVMVWVWLAHPDPDVFCHTLVEAAAPRTTTLSAAFLRAAARGECSAAWHTLLARLARPRGRLLDAVNRVLAHGATSGADMLAGLVCMGRRFRARRAEQPCPE